MDNKNAETSFGYAVLVDFRIKPQFASEFEKEMLANAAASRDTEPGCFQFDVCASADGLEYFLYEIYADAAAFQDHRSTAHFVHFDSISSDWVEHKQVRHLALVGTGSKEG